MAEVRYSVNGKYFKDFEIYISESDGLFDQLKRKTVNTYDWAEYHGSSPDLSNPKFEAREITLKGFVTGADWVAMKANFDAILGEFQKVGTQRLLIEPLGLKTLPYEVYCDDATPLNKTFRQGKMVGTFTLKLIEPNPLKIVLSFTGTSLNLSYTSPKETEIFYGNGLKETSKGNASISGKTLANRVVSGYAFEGRNLLLNSLGGWGNTDEYGGVNYSQNMFIHFSSPLIVGNKYVFSYKRDSFKAAISNLSLRDDSGDLLQSVSVNSNGIAQFTAQKPSKKLYLYTDSISAAYDFWELKLEQGVKETDWSPAPEEQKIIIIAGNVEEITDLTTNATVLWEQL